MAEFIGLTISGISLGAIYAIAASGLVVTYTTSGVFNFAHGAIGMFMAFFYWQLRVQMHWAAPPALIVSLLVVAPLIGLLLQRALIRHINPNDTGLMLVVTVAMLVAFMGLAYMFWNQSVGRLLNIFYGPSRYITIDRSRVTWNELIAIGVALAIALGLRLFFYRTRLGMAMRGVVDDRSLMGLIGGRPQMLSALSWMIGVAFGALAGIIEASTTALDVINLTLLVINSFAAAMLGRLRNLPLTFVGAMLLGLADAYVLGYVPLNGFWANLEPVLPTLFLLVVLLVLPSVRIRAGVAPIAHTVRVPSLRGSLGNGVAVVAIAAIVAPLIHGTVLGDVNAGVALGIGALSIVLLSGYGGYISLCQYSFFGLGAWVFARTGHGGNPVGLLAAVGLGAAVGVIVALPALRLRGLELALSTLAFSQLFYYMFFLQNSVIGLGDLNVPRLHLPGIDLGNDRTNLIFITAVFALLSVGILAIRRGPFGRLLNATKDSEAACATLGLSLRITKVAVFALATAIATFGGAIYGSTHLIVTSDDFQYFYSLFIILAVYIWGVSTPGAALAGGLVVSMAPLVELHLPADAHFLVWHLNLQQPLLYLFTGLGALGLVLWPKGVIGTAGDRMRALFRPLSSPQPQPLSSLIEVQSATAADA